ncbi:MAG: phosphoribosyltransferase family protein [Acidaminococcaceae bacterium]
MKEFLQLLLAVFFPTRCLDCQTTIDSGLWCNPCRQRLLALRKLAPQAYDCPDLESIGLCFHYTGGMRKALHRIKFSGRQRLLPLLAQEVLVAAPEQSVPATCPLPATLVVIPIATDPERQKRRGYEVPTGIFYKWATHKGYRWQNSLTRVRSTQPQYGLNKKARRRNVSNCFAVTGSVQGEDILLVDDIFTSGATMEAAARVLHQQGAHQIWGLALAGGAD